MNADSKKGNNWSCPPPASRNRNKPWNDDWGLQLTVPLITPLSRRSSHGIGEWGIASPLTKVNWKNSETQDWYDTRNEDLLFGGSMQYETCENCQTGRWLFAFVEWKGNRVLLGYGKGSRWCPVDDFMDPIVAAAVIVITVLAVLDKSEAVGPDIETAVGGIRAEDERLRKVASWGLIAVFHCSRDVQDHASWCAWSRRRYNIDKKSICPALNTCGKKDSPLFPIETPERKIKQILSTYLEVGGSRRRWRYVHCLTVCCKTQRKAQFHWRRFLYKILK